MTAPIVWLRPALPIDADARLVMTWRNDLVTLAASFHTEPKVWPAFRDEFFAYFDAPVTPQFGQLDGVEVGFVRFRASADPTGRRLPTVDISINVKPDARGRGIGRALIAASSRLALATNDLVLAEVKHGNNSSSRAFLAAGYRQISDGVHVLARARVPVQRYVIERPR